MSEIVDAELIEEPDTGGAPGGLVKVPQAESPRTLWRTDDPEIVLQRAQATAKALAPVIREAGLVVQVSGKDYLTCEAWQTLGAQLGVTGVVTDTTRLDNGWEARCEARTLDGRVIGAADSMCLRSEDRWKDADEYAIRSMAQTRAMSRALSSVLRFVPTLAGFSGTPAEEVPREGFTRAGGGNEPSPGQLEWVEKKMKFKPVNASEADAALVREWAKETLTGGRDGTCSPLLDALFGKNPDKSPEKAGKEALAAAKEWEAAKPDPDAITPEFEA